VPRPTEPTEPSRSSDGDTHTEGAPRVVLVHGARDEGSSFDHVARALDGVEVVAYDRRGWGLDPDWDGRPVDLAGHTQDLLDILGDGPATVIGHSWGGHVAVAAAIRRPDLIVSVGLWETAMPWAPWWKGDQDRLARKAIGVIASKPPGSPRQNRERLLFMAEATEGLSQSYDLAKFTTPCIVGYGTATIPTFGPGIQALAEQTGAETFALAGATHMVHREAPEDFARFIRRAIALGH
jgi:pimeloyl-ACP methyl ester carboxylesterase